MFPWIQPFGCDASSLLEECIHDRTLHEFVKIVQCLSSWSIVQFQQYSGILHSNKIYSLCIVVKTFQFVLYIVAIEILYVQDHNNPKALLSWHEWRTRLPSHNGSHRSIVIGFTFFTHFCDCTVKTELVFGNNCAKNILTCPNRQNSVSTILQDPWHGRLDVCFRQILTSFSEQFCPIHLVDSLH